MVVRYNDISWLLDLAIPHAYLELPPDKGGICVSEIFPKKDD